MLNEEPTNNDVTHVINIVLNEAPNSNDAMCKGNNVRLTAMGAQFSMVAIIAIVQKSQLTRDER